MNENDRTTLEQAIYEEMELTPEMIRSIRTLCGVCLCSFVESKAFKIAIVPSADRSMDTCTVCQTRRGHDYVVITPCTSTPPTAKEVHPPQYTFPKQGSDRLKTGNSSVETFSSPVSTMPPVRSKVGIVRQSFFRTMWEIFIRPR